MERGTEREREAVRERWTELERQRRAADRLAGGTALVLAGLVLTLFALPGSACLEQGPWVQGCTAIVPAVTGAVLLVGGPVAILAGLWVCWRSLGD